MSISKKITVLAIALSIISSIYFSFLTYADLIPENDRIIKEVEVRNVKVRVSENDNFVFILVKKAGNTVLATKINK